MFISTSIRETNYTKCVLSKLRSIFDHYLSYNKDNGQGWMWSNHLPEQFY